MKPGAEILHLELQGTPLTPPELHLVTSFSQGLPRRLPRRGKTKKLVQLRPLRYLHWGRGKRWVEQIFKLRPGIFEARAIARIDLGSRAEVPVWSNVFFVVVSTKVGLLATRCYSWQAVLRYVQKHRRANQAQISTEAVSCRPERMLRD